MIRIKICGITREGDALIAARAGVDALGFIFAGKSPRYIEPETAAQIVGVLPPFISRVGVFVDEEPERITAIARHVGLDTIQLHGSETPEFCSKIPYPVIKAIGMHSDLDLSTPNAYPVAGVLLDTWNNGLKGGTGMTGDWALAKRIADRYERVILAGGLGPANLVQALEQVQPYGIDLNSGVEIMPGIKNPRKVLDAVKIIRTWKPSL